MLNTALAVYNILIPGKSRVSIIKQNFSLWYAAEEVARCLLQRYLLINDRSPSNKWVIKNALLT